MAPAESHTMRKWYWSTAGVLIPRMPPIQQENYYPKQNTVAPLKKLGDPEMQNLSFCWGLLAQTSRSKRPNTQALGTSSVFQVGGGLSCLSPPHTSSRDSHAGCLLFIYFRLATVIPNSPAPQLLTQLPEPKLIKSYFRKVQWFYFLIINMKFN